MPSKIVQQEECLALKAAQPEFGPWIPQVDGENLLKSCPLMSQTCPVAPRHPHT